MSKDAKKTNEKPQIEPDAPKTQIESPSLGGATRKPWDVLRSNYLAAVEAEKTAVMAREIAENACAERIEESGNKPTRISLDAMGQPFYATAGQRKSCAWAKRQLVPYVPQVVSDSAPD